MSTFRRSKKTKRSRRSNHSRRSNRSRRYRGGDETSRINLKNNLINRYRSNARNPNEAERDGIIRGLAVLRYFEQGEIDAPTEFFDDINELKRIEGIDDDVITQEVDHLQTSNSFDDEDFGAQAQEIMRTYRGE
jgi:hypothetical protein